PSVTASSSGCTRSSRAWRAASTASPPAPLPDPHFSPQVLTTSHDTGGTQLSRESEPSAQSRACLEIGLSGEPGDLLRGDRLDELLGHAALEEPTRHLVQVTLRIIVAG